MSGLMTVLAVVGAWISASYAAAFLGICACEIGLRWHRRQLRRRAVSSLRMSDRAAALIVDVAGLDRELREGPVHLDGPRTGRTAP